MAGDINDGSVGFLTADGSQKTTKQNAEAIRKIENTSKPKPAEKSEFNPPADDRVSSSFNSVRERTNAQVTEAANTVNSDIDNLKEAKKVAQEQKQVLQDIKQAKKDNNTKEEAELAKQFAELQRKRDAVAEKVENDNQRNQSEGARSIRVGNKEVAKVEIKKVEFSKSKQVDLSSDENIKKAISELSSDIKSANSQIQAKKETRDQVRDAAQEARSQISQSEESVIRSAKEAEKAAYDLVSARSQDLVAAQVTDKLNVDIVRQLLS